MTNIGGKIMNEWKVIKRSSLIEGLYNYVWSMNFWIVKMEIILNINDWIVMVDNSNKNLIFQISGTKGSSKEYIFFGVI